MKQDNLFVGGIVITIFLIIGLIPKADGFLGNSNLDFGIVDYKVVNSNINGDILYLSFQIIGKNKGSQPIYNVRVSLGKVPEEVIIYNNKVSYSVIDSYEVTASSETIEISINNYQKVEFLPFTWNIEYDDAFGRHLKGEIKINYRRNLLWPY